MTRQKIPDRKRKPRLPKPFKNKIHFPNGDVWTWFMRGSTVKIRDPQGKDHVFDHVEFWKRVTGRTLTWDSLERAEWKGYSEQFSVRPGMVRQLIETDLLKEKP